MAKSDKQPKQPKPPTSWQVIVSADGVSKTVDFDAHHILISEDGTLSFTDHNHSLLCAFANGYWDYVTKLMPPAPPEQPVAERST